MLERNELDGLLLRCGAGDQQAFASLYRETAPRLLSLCFRMMRRRELAEEVLQEGYVKIWRASSDYDPLVASAMTWMSTIVRNQALDRIRSNKSRPEEIDIDAEGLQFDASDQAPDDRVLRSAAAQRLDACLKRLHENQRQTIYMAYFQGQTHEEISAYLDTPLGTVKAWVRRGVEKLRACLE
ncbi:MAG: sigma-70 family RNA polymerase sigma factor [Thiotrichales bacterium]